MCMDFQGRLGHRIHCMYLANDWKGVQWRQRKLNWFLWVWFEQLHQWQCQSLGIKERMRSSDLDTVQLEKPMWLTNKCSNYIFGSGAQKRGLCGKYIREIVWEVMWLNQIMSLKCTNWGSDAKKRDRNRWKTSERETEGVSTDLNYSWAREKN